MTRKLDRLNGSNDKGIAFQKLWQRNCEIVEGNFGDISQIVTDLAAAVADIAAAQATAVAAQADAAASARESARITSYASPGSGIIHAADVGSDVTVTIDNHVRVYPVQGSIDVPDVSIIGGTITGRAFSTRYYIYYDDTTLADTTPTFQATTTSATAQVGGGAGRHVVGYVDTPADGGAATGGTGGAPPGGAGGGDGGSVAI